MDKETETSVASKPARAGLGSKPRFAAGSPRIKISTKFRRWHGASEAKETQAEERSSAQTQERKSAEGTAADRPVDAQGLEDRLRKLQTAKKQTELEDARRQEADEHHKRTIAEQEETRRAEEERERESEREREREKDLKRQAEAAEPLATTEPAPVAEVPPSKKPVTEETEAAEEESTGKRPRKGRSELRRSATREREIRRRNRRLTVTEALSQEDQEGRQRSLAALRRRNERERRLRQRASGTETERSKVFRDVQIPDVITVQELANRMAEPGGEVIKKLMSLGQMSTINEVLDGDTAEVLVREFGHRPSRVSASDVELGLAGKEDIAVSLRPRAPVVTVMGHVDHGKTSLLDAIRDTKVTQSEAGSITQHIGAYSVETPDGTITFLDTPGHAAFSAMRARGAKITDLVVLVVAADDGLMPQTEEAIDHARAADVPIVVAINKTDLERADPDRVRDHLLRKGLVVEARGGETLDVEVSAKLGDGIPALLEAILLQAGLLDLKANADRTAEGIVVEARLDRGRGAVATVLVKRGTLNRGDIFVVGSHWGRARSIRNDRLESVASAGPSVPVEIDGLDGTPEAGDQLVVVDSEARAREIAKYRADAGKLTELFPAIRGTLETMLSRAKAQRESGPTRQLPLVLKADVRGSAEAILQALAKIGNEDVEVVVLSSGVGAINISDITLAAASDAHVLGFNVRPDAQARETARQYQTVVSYHSVIYELLDQITGLASNLLAPEIREKTLGNAEVLKVFSVNRIGSVAGCRVTRGIVRKGASVRLLRGSAVLYSGNLASLKHHKDDVPSVNAGMECGMSLQNHNDIREGDAIEIFETEEIARSL